MSKASIAIAAFALGVCCAALFPTAQPLRQQPSGPSINWPNFHGYVFHGGRAKGQGPESTGVDLASLGAVPMFNTLDHLPVFSNFTISTVGQYLDGLNCENCNFDNATLRYGGGAVDIKGSTFSGTTELQLEGAAANTVALLEFLKAIPEGRLTYKLPIPNKPITRKFVSTHTPISPKPPTSQPPKMDFTAPYIGPR